MLFDNIFRPNILHVKLEFEVYKRANTIAS